MNLKEIKEIIKLMNENDLSQIELEREGSKIKINKGPTGAPVIVSNPVAEYRGAPAVGSGPAVEAVAAVSTVSGLKEVKAPMVGTFYRAPSPDAPPFVEVGQTVEIGQVLCILEAMKLMNEIKSEVRGKISEIKVENAEPVEFGTVMFLIEPV
ncbi:MAG: acetyl-CoA carboxylase biotin carboxyl carrier protein [Candidatus Omnitrophica bacterium]|nr:acetyl-CoA carboxylase biotin carboxyl carrier protein [Candidatus Omnitrophota bacterium]